MISYFRYWDAKRRLASAQKTIEMMGDSSNYMLEAQKDMLDREVQYYKEESEKLTLILLTMLLVMGTICVFYVRGYYHV